MSNFNRTMMYEPPPCTPDCKERKAGCHSKCDKYIEWAKKKDERKEGCYKESGQIYGYYRSKKAAQ